MRTIKKILHLIGIDVHRYKTPISRFSWLKDLHIETILDIGANTGQFAAEIREHLPGAQIYSFEPLNECFLELNKNFKNDTKFKAFNFALGEKDSIIDIHKSSYSPSSSFLKMADSHKILFPHTEKNTPEQVQVKKLDDIFLELKPKKEVLIKVDTQGYEAMVIAGGNYAFSNAKVIFIEASFIELYEKQPLFDDVYRKMRDFGFSYRGSLHQKINKKNGEVIFEDAIFVRH